MEVNLEHFRFLITSAFLFNDCIAIAFHGAPDRPQCYPISGSSEQTALCHNRQLKKLFGVRMRDDFKKKYLYVITA